MGNYSPAVSYKQAIVNFSSSNIENLLTTPIQLIAAPGNNLFISISSILCYVNFLSAYSNGGLLELQTGASQLITASNIANGLTQSNSTLNSTLLGFVSGQDKYSNLNNQGIYLFQSSGTAFSGGTSTMKIIVYYYIVQAN